MDANSLLELLLTEIRPERLKDEMDRIKEYIKEAERIKRIQQAARGRNEGGADPQRLAGEQAKIADRTGELAKQIAQNEEGQNTQGQPGGEGQEGEKQEGAEGEKKEGAEGEKKEGAEGEQAMLGLG